MPRRRSATERIDRFPPEARDLARKVADAASSAAEQELCLVYLSACVLNVEIILTEDRRPMADGVRHVTAQGAADFLAEHAPCNHDWYDDVRACVDQMNDHMDDTIRHYEHRFRGDNA